MLSYIDKLLNKRGDYLFLQEVTQMSQDRSGIARVTHLMEFVLSNPGHVPHPTFLNEINYRFIFESELLRISVEQC